LNDRVVECLRFAIVKQATEDYVDLQAGFISPTANCNIRELTRFFHSYWFELLCDIEPDYLIRLLERKAATMVLKYTISKQKNSNRYYVREVGSKEPVPDTLGTKKRALHKAAELNGLDYKDYMRVRRRDGVSNDTD